MGVYSDLLGRNTQNYANILGSYAQGQGQAAAQLPGIYGGYNQLGGDVMNTLGMGQVLGQNGNWGVAGPAAQAINKAFVQSQGKTTQNMTNAGLGNTTIGGNLQNQNAAAAALAYGNLGAELAKTAAQQQADIGKTGLDAQMKGLGIQTGLSAQQGGTLGAYKFANTAGDLTGSYGQSSSQSQQASQNQQESQNRQQGSPGTGPSAGQQGEPGLPPGVPGGPGGSSGGGGGTGGGGSGGGGSGVPGVPPFGANTGGTGTVSPINGQYGPTGPNNSSITEPITDSSGNKMSLDDTALINTEMSKTYPDGSTTQFLFKDGDQYVFTKTGSDGITRRYQKGKGDLQSSLNNTGSNFPNPSPVTNMPGGGLNQPGMGGMGPYR